MERALIADGALKPKEPTEIPHTVRLAGHLENACLRPTVCRATCWKSVGVSCDLYALGIYRNELANSGGIRGE